MMDRETVLGWLFDLPYGTGVAVDDGGLTLVDETEEHSLEIGGTPLYEEDPTADGRFDPVQVVTMKQVQAGLQKELQGGVDYLESATAQATALHTVRSDKDMRLVFQTIREGLGQVRMAIDELERLQKA